MWNESRRQLAADLYGVEKTLGITYSRAVDFIAAYSPEFDSAYIDAALIGHCVRELINVLPHYIGEQPVPATAHGDDDRARDCLLAEIDNCNLANRLAAADSGDVLIPQSLAKACIEYRLIRKKGHQKSVTADSTTVFGLPRLDDPGLKPWRGARDFFLRLAHLDRKFESKLPSRDEMDKQLSRIDRSLTTRFGHFFSAKKQLMAMVEKANQRGADGRFERPESSAVLDVLSLVNSEPLRQLLYSNLNNPEWLQPLDEQGAFDAIMRTGEDGVELAWPESTFLVTASEEKAGEVVSIIMRIVPNAGFYGRWAVITIASKVPAEQAATIAPFITKWLKEPEATNSFWDVDALVSISAKLLDRESTYKQGRDLAYAVFTPHSKPSGYGSRCSAESIVRDYRYEEALDSILAHFPLKERCLFLERVLGEHLKIKCRGSSGPSGLLIPSVGAAVAVSDGDKGAVESLATALVAAFRECIASDIERFDKAILGKKPIPKRCALFALFEYLCSGKMLNKDLRHIVESLIDSEVPYDPEYNPETAPLVASLIAGDGKKLANAAFELVSDPRDSLLGRYRQMLDARDEADAEVEASRLVRLWQHERLALLRGQALPAKASALLQSLDEEFGEQEYSFELFTTTTITGPNSPISYEQMSSMSADDLLAHLEIWQPTNQDKWDLVAHAGQARVLQKVIEDNPRVFDGRTDDLKRLRPIYSRHVIDGWATAIRNGERGVVSVFVEMCVWASGLDETAPFDEVPNSIDDDGSYRNIVFSSVDKVTDLLKMDDAGAVFSGYEKELLKVLENGLMSAEPDGEYERKYGSGEDGPVSLALNTIRPRAIEGLSRWAFHFSVHSNVRSALDSLLCVTPAISDSKADAAAFGLAVPWLVSAHLQWVTLHRSEFFGAEKLSMGQQIALDVVLTYYSVSAQMLSYLKPAFKNALSHNSLDCVVGHRLIAHSLGWSIGNWLYPGVALEYIESDDSLVELWESRVGANVAWDVVEHLCAILSNSGDVGEAVVGRVGNLWDRCFERYGVGQGCGDAAFDAISRLAISGFFDNAWWGHRMLSCIQSGLHKSDLSLIIDELLELSKSDSKLAFDIFDAFVNSSAEPISLRFAYEKLAIPILGRAIGLGDANYIDRARNCMDALGAAGMTSLDVDVEKFLERGSAKGKTAK